MDGNIFGDPIVVAENQTDIGAVITAAQGTFVDRTLTFNTIAGNNAGLVGEDLLVFARIGSNPTNADQIAFDAFSITSVAIPEPASAAALGLLGLVGLRRRR